MYETVGFGLALHIQLPTLSLLHSMHITVLKFGHLNPFRPLLSFIYIFIMYLFIVIINIFLYLTLHS